MARDGHLHDKVAAHIDGGAGGLTEARVSIMQRKTKRRPDACAAERRRTAPYTRPDKISASMFPLVRATHSNPLRSRERRFESCRGTLLNGINSNTSIILAESRLKPLTCGDTDAFRTLCPICVRSSALDRLTALIRSI
jgi:hypothetical protein